MEHAVINAEVLTILNAEIQLSKLQSSHFDMTSSPFHLISHPHNSLPKDPVEYGTPIHLPGLRKGSPHQRL
jgi:hypothetical protein